MKTSRLSFYSFSRDILGLYLCSPIRPYEAWTKFFRDINLGDQAHAPYLMVAMVPWASSATTQLHNHQLLGCKKIAVLWIKLQNQWQFRQFKWWTHRQFKHELIFKCLFKIQVIKCNEMANPFHIDCSLCQTLRKIFHSSYFWPPQERQTNWVAIHSILIINTLHWNELKHNWFSSTCLLLINIILYSCRKETFSCDVWDAGPHPS